MDTRATWQTEFSIHSTASPEAIWALFRDVPGWTRWNTGIESISLEGPFAAGTTFVMKPPGEEAFRSLLTAVLENECFVDETRIGGLVITVAHRIECLDASRTRITYAVDAQGEGAGEVGPAISADFPEVLASLAAAAEEKQP